MNERLTWDEIRERYPDTWVGLVDIDWEDEVNIRSAIVKYVNKTKNELARMQIRGEVFSRYTTPDNAFQLGTVML